MFTVRRAGQVLINHARLIVAELHANMVHVKADFSATLFKAKIAEAAQLRVHRMLVIGGRDMEVGGVSVRLPRRPARREAEGGGGGGYFGGQQSSRA